MLLAGCAQQRAREEAKRLMDSGQYEQAHALLEQGLAEAPDSAELRAGLIETRADAAARLIAAGIRARSAGRTDEAQALFKRAVPLDGNGRAQSLLDDLAIERRTKKALADAQGLVAKRQPEAALKLVGEALKESPRHTELVGLQRKLLAEVRGRQITASQSGLAETRPISLDFRDANLRSVLDVVSRHSGLNFLLDKDIRSDVRVSIFLRSARVEDALDLIVSTHQLAKKVLDERTVLIYPNTAEKGREHQEQLVRVFYLASAEAKGAAAFLRSMLKLRDPFVDERANMIALRESPENIALAERLLSLYDSQDPEVLLEVEVLEVRTSRLTELGVKLPDSFTLTPFAPGNAASLTLGNIASLTRDDIRIGVGGATVSLKRQVGDFNTLANPRIRTRNKEKAKVLIGDRVPVFTATTGQAGFVADSVSYLDVGLKLDVEPTIFPDDEVAIKINLEVSTIAREIRTASGSLAYQLGTRNATTALRLKDGETQLLAGLISREDRMSASRVPGIGDLPVMGRLFSSQSDDSQRTELVLAITPRILRNLRQLDAAESEVWVGTEAQPRLRPYGGRHASVEPAGALTTAPQPGATASAGPIAPPLAGPIIAARPAAISTRLRGPAEVAVGDVFVVAVEVDAGAPLRGGPLQIAYDKSRLTLLDASDGDLLRRGTGAVAFTKAIEAAQGSARVGSLRAEATGVVGQGTLFNLRFKALAAGDADVRIAGFEPVVMGETAGVQSQTGTPLRLQVKP